MATRRCGIKVRASRMVLGPASRRRYGTAGGGGAGLLPKSKQSDMSSARASRWFDVSALPPLAFDHAELIHMALEHLRRRLGETPVCFELLPAELPMTL